MREQKSRPAGNRAAKNIAGGDQITVPDGTDDPLHIASVIRGDYSFLHPVEVRPRTRRPSRVTGQVLLDLSDLDRFNDSDKARRRLYDIGTVPAGATVVLRVGHVCAALVDLHLLDLAHVDYVVQGPPDSLAVGEWVTRLREVTR